MIKARICVVLLCAFVNASLFAADRTLVAEGEYAIHTKDGIKPYNHWKLWQEADATFSAEVERVMMPDFAQTFYFDSNFLPSGYSLTVTRHKEGDKVGMTCHRESEILSCDSSFEGKSSSTSMKVGGPCLVIVDEAPGLDLVWLFAALLRMPTAGTTQAICEYVLKDKKLGELSLESKSSPERIVPDGEQPAEILGKNRIIRTYEVGNNNPMTGGEMRGKDPTVYTHKFGHNDIWTVRVLPSGVIVSMNIKDSSNGGFELTEYKEYRQWAH